MLTIKDFYKKLMLVLDRPAMFGIQRVEDISVIFFTQTFFNSNDSIEKVSVEFREFVRKDINETLVNFDWSRIIRLYSGSDYHSLELFRKLFTMFIEERFENKSVSNR